MVRLWEISVCEELLFKSQLCQYLYFFKDIVCASSEEITGYKPELNAKGGTSDGRFVAAMNTEIVELGPVNKSIHQIDEHVSVNDLWKLKDIYEKILINLNQSL